jgi:secernin
MLPPVGLAGPAESAGPAEHGFRICCDSALALGTHTRSGAAIFAKNSDRPWNEAQPLMQIAAADHEPGAKLSCQYIEIDQVERTHAFFGSRPHWLWGCEHGINEHDVVIGNHTIYTKDEVPDVGLQGMDLVRLGLERGRSAREAVDVIAALAERHGQGGSGFLDFSWAYHSSFLVVDPIEAFLLEASGRNWALKRVHDVASASNHTSIGSDWDELSADCVAHAAARGWWSGGDQRFDFAAAYRDTSVIPPFVSSGRFRTTCEALRGGTDGKLALADFQRMMRDHYGSGDVHVPGAPTDDETFFSVCMHAGEVGMTASSMIVELGAPELGPRMVWVTFCNPCVSPYLPLFPEARIPEPLLRGGREQQSGGAWWAFKNLLTGVERDPEAWGPLVRSAWQPWETELAAEAVALAAELADRDPASRRAALESFMESMWTRTEAELARVIAECLPGVSPES